MKSDSNIRQTSTSGRSQILRAPETGAKQCRKVQNSAINQQIQSVDLGFGQTNRSTKSKKRSDFGQFWTDFQVGCDVTFTGNGALASRLEVWTFPDVTV